MIFWFSINSNVYCDLVGFRYPWFHVSILPDKSLLLSPALLNHSSPPKRIITLLKLFHMTLNRVIFSHTFYSYKWKTPLRATASGTERTSGCQCSSCFRWIPIGRHSLCLHYEIIAAIQLQAAESIKLHRILFNQKLFSIQLVSRHLSRFPSATISWYVFFLPAHRTWKTILKGFFLHLFKQLISFNNELPRYSFVLVGQGANPLLPSVSPRNLQQSLTFELSTFNFKVIKFRIWFRWLRFFSVSPYFHVIIESFFFSAK